MSEHVHHINDSDFDEKVLKANQPVLVDFWAQWCGPCKMIAPILEEIAPEYAGKLVITKMDVDANPQTPGRYGVRGIPSLLIFKNGELAGTKVGALSKSQLKAFIDGTI
jgi:thioredoxin 1